MSLSERFSSVFQARMLSLAVQQPLFLDQYSDIFSASLFSSLYHKEIATWLVDFYRVYRKLPSHVSMNKILRDHIPSNDPLFKGYRVLVDQIYDTEVLDHEFVRDQLLNAARFQNLKGALLRMTDLVDKGEFDQLSKVLNQALDIGSGAGEIGLDLRTNLEKSIMMFDTLEQPIDIGFKKLEGFTGGFYPGELTAVIAPAGRGKTAVLGAFAHGISKSNTSSIYYTLEIRDRRLLLRFYSRIAKIPIKELMAKIDKARYRLRIFNQSTKGTCIVKFWPSGSITIDTIRSHLMKAYGQDIRPVAIFIDYAELIRPARVRERNDLEITDLYRDMRSLGAEFNLHTFVASQAKTESWGNEIIGMGDSSGSQGKEATVDSWISVNRTTEEEAAGVARLFVGKARMEKSGRIIHVAFDLDRMTIYEIDVEDYRERMTEAGFKTSEAGRPFVGKNRKERSSELDAHYNS